MEEFSDLDDETGTNIVYMNNTDISKNIVEPIEYQLPDVNRITNKAQFNNLYSNLNDKIIKLDNPVGIRSFDNRYFSKRYINNYDKIIDDNFCSNLRINEHPHNNINENPHINFNNNRINANPNLNRLIEIKKNYYKINHKKDYYAEINNENKENCYELNKNKSLNSPDNAFSGIIN